MDDQQPANGPIAPNPVSPSGPPQTQQQPPIQPGAPTPAPSKPHMSKAKRIVYFIVGVLLVVFSLSIVQGQVTHSWDVIGIVMILVFGIPGLYILYYSALKVSS